MRSFSLAAISLLGLAACAGACGQSRSQSSTGQVPGPEAAGSAGRQNAGTAGGAAPGGGQPHGTNADGSPKADAPAYDGPYFGATAFQALVLSDMEWPRDSGRGENKVQRLGYLRIGGKAPVIPEAHKKANCSEGWYELVAGGYVCGKYGTLDLNHPKFKMAHAADLSGPLPYTYGINGINGNPLYRTVPSKEERRKYEPWLGKHVTAAPTPRTGASDAPPVPPLPSRDNPYASFDAGAASSSGPTIVTASGATITPNNPAAAALDPPAPQEDDTTPWYLRTTDGGAPPNVTLDELKEDDGGPVARRMVKGFYLSLDKQFVSNNVGFWRLNDGLITPSGWIQAAKPKVEYHGLWLADSATPASPTDDDGGDGVAVTRRIDKLPVGFISSKTAHKWIMADSRKHATPGGALHQWEVVGLTDQAVTISGVEFFETVEGWWIRGLDGTKTEPGPAPEGLGADERWVDVNLKRQTLVAYEGDKPVFVTMVSSGREKHETPPGSFRIREKHIASTMDGDAEIASDGPYSIQDVPWIQYFNAGYALHGAFWHDAFGHVKSHGCVNLAPLDAKALFNWTEPRLPDGWHGVSATKEKPGSHVVVHY